MHERQRQKQRVGEGKGEGDGVGRQTNRKTDRQRDRQTDRQTDRTISNWRNFRTAILIFLNVNSPQKKISLIANEFENIIK